MQEKSCDLDVAKLAGLSSEHLSAYLLVSKHWQWAYTTHTLVLSFSTLGPSCWSNPSSLLPTEIGSEYTQNILICTLINMNINTILYDKNNKKTIRLPGGEYDTDMNTIRKFCIHIVFWPALPRIMSAVSSEQRKALLFDLQGCCSEITVANHSSPIRVLCENRCS